MSHRSPPLPPRTIRWGGALILLFLVYHILHFTVGTAHPGFVEGDPYHNVATGFRTSCGRDRSTSSPWPSWGFTSITGSGAAAGVWA